MKSKVQKWGNSLAVRLPKPFVKEVRIAYGTPVDITVDEGKIVINPHTAEKYELDDLLRGVTKNTIHSEVETGVPAGKEIW